MADAASGNLPLLSIVTLKWYVLVSGLILWSVFATEESVHIRSHAVGSIPQHKSADISQIRRTIHPIRNPALDAVVWHKRAWEFVLYVTRATATWNENALSVSSLLNASGEYRLEM
jgi:hypothetical protein